MSVGLSGAVDRLLDGVGDLVESHQTKAGPESFAPYADNILGFFRDVLRVPETSLWPGMVEMLLAIQNNAQTAVVTGHAIGKDWAAAGATWWGCLARGALVLSLAPKDLQAVEIMGRELRNHFRRGDLPGELFTRAVRLPWSDSAGVLLMSAGTDESKLTGFHADAVMVVLSEVQGLEQAAIEAVSSCAVGERDRIVAIGNPIPNTPLQRIARAGSGWHTVRLSAFDHPNVQRGRTIIPGAVTQSYIDRVRTEFGEDSPQYRIKVLGEFPSAAENALVRPEWLDASNDRHRAGPMGGVLGAGVVIGCDPAREGKDTTVLAVRVGRRVDRLESLPKADTQVNASQIVAKAELLGYRVRPQERAMYDATAWKHRESHREPALLRIDAIGIGAGVFDRLRAMRAHVEDFVASRKPQYGDETYLNQRAEVAWCLRTLLERGAIDLPADDRLREELLAMTWSLDGKGRIVLTEKDRLRAVLGRSPDAADAVMIAVQGMVIPVGNEMRLIKLRWA